MLDQHILDLSFKSVVLVSISQGSTKALTGYPEKKNLIKFIKELTIDVIIDDAYFEQNFINFVFIEMGKECTDFNGLGLNFEID